MQRLGLNREGYQGERLNLDATLEACRTAGARHGWNHLELPPASLGRFAFRRPSARPEARRIYISAGIHGDEPAGPLAALHLLEANDWPDADLWILPCLNPLGLRASSRTNAAGVDINRDYRHFRSDEARGHVEWLAQQPSFDLTLLLHEDWESHGFYTYEVNRGTSPSLAPAMVSAVRPVCPVDDSPEIDGRPISEPGIIRPALTPETRPEWPEALWLIVNKSPLSYTLEAPSDWPLATRVEALVRAVQAALKQFVTG